MSAAEVDARVRALYGEALGAMEGVLHVVAVAGSAHRVMRIGPWSPKSEADFFALELARARVEAILITGAILRAEPGLRYGLSPGLAAWRRKVLGLTAPPWLVVLSRGEVPLDHPALTPGPVRPLVFTSSAAARALEGASVEVVGVPRPSARGALALLSERGCHSVSIEAGPQTATGLYDPLVVDELALSVFEGTLDERARGGLFLDEGALRERMVRVSRVQEGEWRFERWLRAPG